MISRPFATFLAFIAAVSSLAVVLIATSRSATHVAADPYVLPPEVVAPQTVWLDELTWAEVAQLIVDGTSTVIVPTAGVEQNGLHMALGKHEAVVSVTAERIAIAVGKTLVAPPIVYVPEGEVSTRSDHMAWPGTLSLPADEFAATLKAAAESLKAAGFTTIVFVGDSSYNQEPQEVVAEKLSRQWRGDAVTVASLAEYYYTNGQVEWLVEQGFSEAEIGGHAGIRDTSELLAIDPTMVRMTLLDQAGSSGSGSSGAATLATAAIGEVMLDLKVAAGVKSLERVLEGS